MEGDLQLYIAACLALILLIAAIAYFRLASVLSKTNQVLEIWETLVETPILGAHVGRIFTFLLKIRNPYTRSISIISGKTHLNRLPDYIFGSGTMSRDIETTTGV
jgi:hypothetical protein